MEAPSCQMPHPEYLALSLFSSEFPASGARPFRRCRRRWRAIPHKLDWLRAVLGAGQGPPWASWQGAVPPPLRMLPSARRQATQEPSSRGGGRRSQWADLEACYGKAAQLQVTVQARHEPLKKPTKNAIYVESTKEYSRLLNCPSGSGTTCH